MKLFENIKNYWLVKKSRLFDEEFYLSKYSDVINLNKKGIL